MSTTVFLYVTPLIPVDPNAGSHEELPVDLADIFAAAGQGGTTPGFSRRGSGPWRWQFQLSGPDRAQAAQTLRSDLEGLGYDVDVMIMR